MSTNGIVILVFFTAWSLAEFQSIFSNAKTNLLTLEAQLASVVLFLTSTAIWFFRDNWCEGPLSDIENAVLYIVPISPITFLAARFNLPFTSLYGLNFLCISVIKELWPAREGRCALPILSIGLAIVFISIVIIVKFKMRPYSRKFWAILGLPTGG